MFANSPSMHHSHSCDHCLTSKGPSSAQKARLLWTALILIGSFAIAELLVGLQSNSLALVAEAGHMVSDTVALGMALIATWIARLPASPRAPFGYRRIEILAALANGTGLMLIAIWIGWEAIERVQSPPEEILSLPMLITAAIGFLVNTLNALLLHRDSHHDLNLRGAFLHMVADAVSSVGVLVAAIVVWHWHWLWIDGVISLFVSALIIAGAIPLARQSLNILLEKTPDAFDPEALKSYLTTFAGVKAVPSLNLWTIAPGQESLTAHLWVDVEHGRERDRLLTQIQDSLQQEFGLQSVTLQLTAPPPPFAASNPLSDNLNRLLATELAPE
ncbi:MAG: cation diffusion facilitator family transporter [Leptolyngbyaceae cyanobacterium bins.59]|nr:cation diffusion facilitator family transporter [Leptolyngbyaceae cyanobacterium bins.59]